MAARPNEAIANPIAGIQSGQAINPAGGDVTLSRVSRGIFVGVSGTLVVQFVGDPDANTTTLTNVAAGVWHAMQVQKVLQAGTTATGVVVGY